MNEIGHNSGVKAEDLRAFIARIERLMDDRDAVNEDIKTVFGEARSSGWDPKLMRRVIAIRKMDPQDRAQQEELLGIYLDAVGT